jgi:protein O-mannosyl-transferase
MLTNMLTNHTQAKTRAAAMSRAAGRILPLCGILALVLLAYGNHFQNSFHFDDSHAIVDNPYLRDLHNIPRFFTDGRTSSVLPANRVYRPIVSTSLAIDYWMGHGFQPLWFHISTFFWFLVQLGLMFVLFRGILHRTRPFPRAGESSAGTWTALFATALYGVHPAIAETVNYIIQRSDLYAALAVVAGLVIYIQAPRLRWSGLYLLPVVAGILSKAPAAVFPALLFAWIWLFDDRTFQAALGRSLPALAVAGAAGWFTILMTPPTFVAGASSAYGYWITQPAVLLGYFLKFFIPAGLSADTDRVVFASMFQPEAIYGWLFVAALAALALGCAKHKETRPIAFGLVWFLAASLPTSLIALAEVENDHRMYLPFVGLTLSVAWAATLLIERHRIPAKILVAAGALILVAFAAGTRERNRVWSSEESLWHDVTIKSPNNGRGLMNYGSTQMGKGRYNVALDYFQRALVLNPNYHVLEINLGIATGAVGNAVEAQRHFQRAIELAPADASARYYYARWLTGAGREKDALEHLRVALEENPDYLAARYLIMQIYATAGDVAGLRREAQETATRFPSDATAGFWLSRAANLHPSLADAPAVAASAIAAASPTAEGYLNLSLAMFRAGKYTECIAAAREALKIRPDFAEAWNNIGAAYNAMSQWDEGIAAVQEAVRLKPDFQIAKNNLTWAKREKQNLSRSEEARR